MFDEINISDSIPEEQHDLKPSVVNQYEHFPVCGDVFVANEKKAWINCKFCAKKFTKIEMFAKHVLMIHYEITNSYHSFETVNDENNYELTNNTRQKLTDPIEVPKKYNTRSSGKPIISYITRNSNKKRKSRKKIDEIKNEDVNNENLQIKDKLVVLKEKLIFEEYLNTPENVETPEEVPLFQENIEIIDNNLKVETVDECGIIFENHQTTDVENIIELEKPEKRMYQCELCGSSFKIRNKLFRHFQVHLRADVFIADTIKTMKEKILNEPKIKKTHKCSICEKIFIRPSRLRVHVKTHYKIKTEPKQKIIKEKNIVAKKKTTAVVKEKLPIEIKMKEIKKFKCKYCPDIFEDINEYHVHTLLHGKVFKCHICDKSYAKRRDLADHLNMHGENLQYKCDECGKFFVKKGSLSYHIRGVHLKERNHVCNYCNKQFMRKVQLTIHLRIHTGEKPYICEQCGAAFQTNSLLKNHTLRHDNIKNYHCELCEKKFYNRSYLNNHILAVHTDQKPFACEVCGARFNGRPALRKHKKLHLGFKEYICKICGKAYAQSPGLYAHMKSHQLAKEK